ncbi:hypothetical protein VNO77_03651 [Canavalia gladiata]|uniref:Uncharacterized protein n=1 Tax=Canavalia gladiata TaxID=3824 RepID=A0AAN9R718_CANGL
MATSKLEDADLVQLNDMEAPMESSAMSHYVLEAIKLLMLYQGVQLWSHNVWCNGGIQSVGYGTHALPLRTIMIGTHPEREPMCQKCTPNNLASEMREVNTQTNILGMDEKQCVYKEKKHLKECMCMV